jgi:tRNA1(Val) A37 N6-methylase TrmN6
MKGGDSVKPRLTKDAFIERAKSVHGDKYDYSKVEYVNTKTHVIIICPEHGEFLQKPEKHMIGRGCPKCANSRVEETNLKKYGVRRPLQSKAIHDKMEQTNIERYGHKNPTSCPDIMDKVRNTCRERYGVDYAVQAEHVKKQKEQTLQEKYGGNSPFSSEEIQEKAHETIRNKYGIANPMDSFDIKQKVSNSKRENNTFHTSLTEDNMYEILCQIFGADDIERQFSSIDYPYLCDFYVISRDMYIELNASWTHGYHWFDGLSESDCKKLSELKSKSDSNNYYANAVYVWSERDIEKRECARKHKLNYIVFWDNKLRDFDVWVALSCPDGQDWSKEYSWLPERNIKGMPFPKTITGTKSNFSLIAKAYQFSVFYENEIRLWNENSQYKNLPLQLFLYYNRLQYTNKTPNQLSDLDLMRGFTVSGIRKGYTVFDTTLMDAVIKKYNIKSVYDPCAGWGERLLYCYYHDIQYLGVDINDKLQSGYEAMIHDFNIKNQTVICNDSSDYVPTCKSDAIITCPPYGSTEIYTDKGSENLSKSDFLKWWNKVIANSSVVQPEYFCFQINQKWKASMTEMIKQNGFEFVEELIFDGKQSSHFTKRNGIDIKSEYESMIVMRKLK